MNQAPTEEAERKKDIKKTAGNVSSTLIVRVLRYPFLALYFILIPRMMGAHEYGQLALFISLLMLLSEILSFGSPVALGKLFPEFLHKREMKKAQRMISGFIAVMFITSLLLFIAGSVFLYVTEFKEYGTNIYVIFYFALVSEIFSQLFFSILFGLNEVGKYNLFHLFRTVFRFVFIYLLYPGAGFEGAMLALLITPVISMLYALYSLKKAGNFKIHKPVIKEFLPEFRFGIVMFAPTLLFILQQQIGPILLKTYSMANDEIAFFDLANQFFLVLFGLTVTIYEALIPISSKFEQTGLQNKSINWLVLLQRYILCAFILVIISFYSFGKALIVLILGNEFERLYYVALTILLSIPFWSVGQIGYVRSVVLSRIKVYYFSTLISFSTFLIFSLILTPFFGGIGIACGVILSSIAYASAIPYYYPEIFSKLKDNVKNILLASLVFLPLFFISDTLLLNIFIFIPVSTLFIWIMIKNKIIDKVELQGVLSSTRFKPG